MRHYSALERRLSVAFFLAALVHAAFCVLAFCTGLGLWWPCSAIMTALLAGGGAIILRRAERYYRHCERYRLIRPGEPPERR